METPPPKDEVTVDGNPFAAGKAANGQSLGDTIALITGAVVFLLVLVGGTAVLWEALRLHAVYTGSLDGQDSLLQQLTTRQQTTLVVGELLVVAAAWLVGRRMRTNMEGQFDRAQASRERRCRLEHQVAELQRQVRENRESQPSGTKSESQ